MQMGVGLRGPVPILGLVLLVIIYTASCSYLTEPPIKLLTVSSYAVRFPAAKSKYRTSIQNGKDEAVDMQSIDVLNGFPTQKLVLQPGGCATYILPVQKGQRYMFVEPARKKRAMYADYCGKGKVNIKARVSKDFSFSCFNDTNDCSSKSCLGDLKDIVDLKASGQQLHVDVCADPKSVNEGRVWELKLSVSDDPQKLNGVMQNDAALRLRHTQDIPEFNTQISITSLVGKRAVGKSTIASLLSGNETMFVTGSSTRGTTTTGADISTVIPTKDYAAVISKKIGKPTFTPKKTLPMFLVDSEGMNLRGDAFDFATTSPPAVVAKMIIWVGEGTLQTAGILHDIGKYLDGLDQIIMGGQSSGTTCDPKKPTFGHFAIVLNKMLGASSDEQLFAEIMTDEPDYIEGYDQRNQIRDKLRKCFAGLTVHGLPKMNSAPSYANLDERFKQGLSKIVDTILDSTTTPRTVSVGPMSLEMNATNAENIMYTVIKQANKGKIDLTGLDSFWSFKEEEVRIALDKAKQNLNVASVACRPKASQPNIGSVECTPCVCAFNKKLVDQTVADVTKVVQSSKQEAAIYFKADSTAQVNQITDIINQWKMSLRCEGVGVFNSIGDYHKKIFDMGSGADLSRLKIGTNHVSDVKVESAFFCNHNSLAHFNTAINIEASNVYIHDDSSIDLNAPGKKCDGKNGEVNKPDGSNGCDGEKGRGFTLNGKKLLKGSAASLRIVSRGGAGGNGGNGQTGPRGKDGAKGANGANGVRGKDGGRGADNTAIPTDGDAQNADGVAALGKLVRTVNGDQGHHCSCRAVKHTITQYYEYNKVSQTTGNPGGKGTDGTDAKDGLPGGNGSNGGVGGKGGNGGKGGDSGDIKLVGIKGLTLHVERVGGTGGMGRCQNKKFTAEKFSEDSCSCNVFHCHCRGVGGSFTARNFQKSFGPATNCNQGRKGDNGKPGKTAKNGAQGKPGSPGAKGADGKPGAPGASKNEDIHA